MFLLFTTCFFAVVASVSYCLRAYSSVTLPSQKAAWRMKCTNTQTYTHTLTWQMFWEHSFQILWRSRPLSWRSLCGPLCRFLEGDFARCSDPDGRNEQHRDDVDVNVIAEHSAEKEDSPARVIAADYAGTMRMLRWLRHITKSPYRPHKPHCPAPSVIMRLYVRYLMLHCR